MISDYHDRNTRSRAMSWHQSSVYVGTVAGGVLGGFFAEWFGWRTGFYFFGLAGIGLGLILSRRLREPARGQADLEAPLARQSLSVRQAVREIFRTPTAVLLMVVFVGANFVAMMFLTWMPTFLGEKFGLRLTVAGLTGTVFIQFASAIGAPMGGFCADRLARRHPGGRILVQASGLLAGSTFVFLTGTTAAVGHLMLWMTIFGFCKGLYDANIFASLYDVVHPSARATAAGVMNAVGWLGGAFAPVITGWIVSRGGPANEVKLLGNALAFGGTIYLGAAILLFATVIFRARRDVVEDWRG